MPPFRIVAYIDAQAALSRSTEEAFHLRVDIEFVPSAVGDVHVEGPVLQPEGIEHFDRILARDRRQGLRSSAVKGIDDLLDPYGDHPVETAQDLIAAVKLRSPAP